MKRLRCADPMSHPKTLPHRPVRRWQGSQSVPSRVNRDLVDLWIDPAGNILANTQSVIGCYGFGSNYITLQVPFIAGRKNVVVNIKIQNLVMDFEFIVLRNFRKVLLSMGSF